MAVIGQMKIGLANPSGGCDIIRILALFDLFPGSSTYYSDVMGQSHINSPTDFTEVNVNVNVLSST